jgi:signal peptidase I
MPSHKPSGAFGEFWEIVKTLLWAAVIAIVIRTFAYEPFNIPSGSMIPTLLVGDYLFVSKTRVLLYRRCADYFTVTYLSFTRPSMSTD